MASTIELPAASVTAVLSEVVSEQVAVREEEKAEGVGESGQW